MISAASSRCATSSVNKKPLVVMWLKYEIPFSCAIPAKNGASSSMASMPYSGSPPNQLTVNSRKVLARALTRLRIPSRTSGSMVPRRKSS
ncbi:hypothetical protein D3C81_1510190 [compost metagenome]